jgi:hypothetical protein
MNMIGCILPYHTRKDGRLLSSKPETAFIFMVSDHHIYFIGALERQILCSSCYKFWLDKFCRDTLLP